VSVLGVFCALGFVLGLSITTNSRGGIPVELRGDEVTDEGSQRRTPATNPRYLLHRQSFETHETPSFTQMMPFLPRAVGEAGGRLHMKPL